MDKYEKARSIVDGATKAGSSGATVKSLKGKKYKLILAENGGATKVANMLKSLGINPSQITSGKDSVKCSSVGVYFTQGSYMLVPSVSYTLAVAKFKLTRRVDLTTIRNLFRNDVGYSSAVDIIENE